MAYTIQTAINDLAGVTHGTTVNKIPNLYGAINRAARAVLLDVDPKETQRIVQLSQVFNNVFDYAVPTDLKGDKIVDLRIQAGRKPGDIFQQGYSQDFDANKLTSFKNKIITQWNTGIKTLRIEAPTLTAPLVLSDTSSLTGWATTVGASTLTLDTTNNVAGGGALTFNLAAGSASGYVENSILSAIDLSTHVSTSTLFMWVYMPTGASVTSVDLRWGSSSANYYNYTTTVSQQGTAFVNGWNILAFPWVSATKTGTPVNTSYTYSRVTVNYNSTLQTGFKVDNITSNLGYIFELQYYSKFLFRDPSTNAFQESVTDATDNLKLINLDTESYNLFFNKLVMFVAQQLQGSDAAYDATFFDSEYEKGIKLYKAQNLSENMLKGSTYYQINRPRYRRFSGRK